MSGIGAKALNKVRDIEIEAKNLLENGDFSKGMGDWEKHESRLEGGVIIFDDPDTTNLQPRGLLSRESYVSVNGDVIYMGARIAYSGKNSLTPRFLLNAGKTQFTTFKELIGENGNTNLTHASANIKLKGQNVGARVSLYIDAARPIEHVGDPQMLKFTNITVLNLTDIFGKGNEPSAEQMGIILSQFPNSWFDGTQTITKEFMIMLLKEMNGIRNVQKAMLGGE